MNLLSSSKTRKPSLWEALSPSLYSPERAVGARTDLLCWCDKPPSALELSDQMNLLTPDTKMSVEMRILILTWGILILISPFAFKGKFFL